MHKPKPRSRKSPEKDLNMKANKVFFKDVMDDLGMNHQKELAELLGLSEPTVSRYLKGEKYPDDMDAILENLGMEREEYEKRIRAIKEEINDPLIDEMKKNKEDLIVAVDKSLDLIIRVVERLLARAKER